MAYNSANNRNKTTLFGIFIPPETLKEAVGFIKNNFSIPSKKVFVYTNRQDLMLSFVGSTIEEPNLNTKFKVIKFHRNAQYNTFFTIDALNEVIKSKNNGVLNESFVIDFSEFENKFLFKDFKNKQVKISDIDFKKVIDLDTDEE